MPSRSRPIETFARAVAQCSGQASVYGKCIVEDYNHVHKDKCLREFLRLKDCYVVSIATSEFGACHMILTMVTGSSLKKEVEQFNTQPCKLKLYYLQGQSMYWTALGHFKSISYP